MHEKDQLIRFLFDKTNVRGEFIQLDATWQAIQERYTYPSIMNELLGQAMAAAILLSATIKFNGSMNLQIQGTGPLTLLVVQVQSNRTIRGTIDWTTVPEGELAQYSLPELFQEGHLAITIEPSQSGDRYQGIVDLGERGLKEALEQYFQNSEQLATRLWLAADHNIAAGLLVQQMPAESTKSNDDDIWNRVQQLSETITDKELLQLTPSEVLHRLFHEENVRVFEPEVVSFRCSCSKERIADVLRGMGHADVKELLEQESEISVDCQFCRQNYRFDAVDVEQLFATDVSPNVTKTRH